MEFVGLIGEIDVGDDGFVDVFEKAENDEDGGWQKEKDAGEGKTERPFEGDDK